MGYTTTFKGKIEINNFLTDELTNYINKFSSSRRMKRDVSKISREDIELYGFKGMAGVEGEYLIDDKLSISDYNQEPITQPGLWCQWIISDNKYIEWDGGEKFYSASEWMQYIIDNFLKPFGYICNGIIEAQGEDDSDKWQLIVENNIVKVELLISD